MSKVAKNPAIDPTLPKVELTINGKPYFLCFTFGALATAAAKLRALGIQTNVLRSLDITSVDADQIAPLFYASVITHQPDLDYEAASSLITLQTMWDIFNKVIEAYSASLSPADKTDPKQEPVSK